jgi:chromosome segregation protein
VETVLGDYLEAVCVDGLDDVAQALDSLTQGAASFFDTGLPPRWGAPMEMLASRASGVEGAVACCAAYYAVEDLGAGRWPGAGRWTRESVITRDGIWLGPELAACQPGRRPALRGAGARAGNPRTAGFDRRRGLRGRGARGAARGDSRAPGHAGGVPRRSPPAGRRSSSAAAGLQATLQTARSRMEQAATRLQALERESARSLHPARGGRERRFAVAAAGCRKVSSSWADFEHRRTSRASGALARPRCTRRARRHGMIVPRRRRSRSGSSRDAPVSTRRASACSASRTRWRASTARKQELERQLEAGVEPLAERQRALEALLAQRLEVDENLAGARRKVQGWRRNCASCRNSAP